MLPTSEPATPLTQMKVRVAMELPSANITLWSRKSVTILCSSTLTPMLRKKFSTASDDSGDMPESSLPPASMR